MLGLPDETLFRSVAQPPPAVPSPWLLGTDDPRLRVPDKTAETILPYVEGLFRMHGPPLVVKADNGGAFTAQEMKKLMERYGVTLLLSPPRTPQYNGAIEASIGWLQNRTRERTAIRCGHTEQWSSNDCEGARLLGNRANRPRKLRGRTPEEAWTDREPITVQMRERFALVLTRERARPLAGYLPGIELPPYIEASLERKAIGRALVKRGILKIRRRRISLPLKSLLGSNIT